MIEKIKIFLLSIFLLFPFLGTAQKKEPLFGKKYAKYSIQSQSLKGAVFYLISGHGGPDPGCIGFYNNHELHEDEYAYDIILRLGRRLLENGAKVYFIIQDEKDGIRDESVLDNSKRETCRGEKIPLDQVERLNQRCRAVNQLFYKDKSKYKRAIVIHVDSRSKRNQLDVFAYYAPNSKKGKQLGEQFMETFEKEYHHHQPNRGFTGSVTERNLYVLRNTHPVASFIELGNIQNQFDQRRLLIPDNRQALANWMTEAIKIDYKKETQKSTKKADTRLDKNNKKKK